ncbi:MAG: hypothetical protein AAB229_04465 [Candidatus Hydrogenedentota bacterium]
MKWTLRNHMAIFYTLIVVSFSAWLWYLCVPAPYSPPLAEIETGMRYSPLPELLMPRLEKQYGAPAKNP